MVPLLQSVIENYRSESPTVVAVGMFDGVHRGHRAILLRANEISAQLGYTAIMLTFDPHPREVITPGRAPKLLTTVEEKSIVAADCFAGQLVVVRFDEQVRNLTAEQFARQVLRQQLQAKFLVVGYNHALGKDRTGTTSELRRIGQEQGFEVEVVEAIICDGKPVSSTRIRDALLLGDMEAANSLLGYEYLIRGSVVRGVGLGKKLGYPTANLNCPENKCLPREGIYACTAEVSGRQMGGMLFIGRNYFNSEGGITVEVHVFNYDGDLYGQAVTVRPLRYVRENRRFATTAELVTQMADDKRNVMTIVSKGERKCQ